MDTTIIKNNLSAFNKKSDLKHGLPSWAYTSDEFFDAESKTVFTNNWVFAGFVHEFKDPGDAIPITVAGQPIILLQNMDGKINAFHNACSHRCLKLIDESCNVGAMLSCPYLSLIHI